MNLKDKLHKAIPYNEYRTTIEGLVAEKKTSGPTQNEDYAHYTLMNFQRMKRLEKTTQLSESFEKKITNFKRKLIWLILTEAWCGDAAQNIPVLEKIASSAPHISTLYLFRDEHIDLIDHYLTNGGRSIPKLICLDENSMEVLGTWGPRPFTIQRFINKLKEEGITDLKETIEKVQVAYNHDGTVSLQEEISHLLDKWS